MLCEQDQRAVEAMVRCNMELDELCVLFPKFDSEDIGKVIQRVTDEKIETFADMHSVSIST